MLCSCALFILLLLYVFFDINYFLRSFFTLAFGRLFKKKNFKDTCSIYGVCSPQDLDIFLRHMNNARFIRELDFARFSFYDRSGLYSVIKGAIKNAVILQGACAIRYRRPIAIGALYRVDTRLIWWDTRNLYLEHQFVTPGDGFVRAVALSQQIVTGAGKGTGTADLSHVMTQAAPDFPKPEPLPELTHWLSSIEASSARLRKRN